MTSKSLFFKRIKQDLHQRVWFPVLLFIVAFLVMELTLVSELDRLSVKLNAVEQMKLYLTKFFTISNVSVIIMSAVAAVFCAISGFSYMHSSRKLDTYHSMPIKREQLFGQQYVYGILYYIVPMLIHTVICLGIGIVMGAFSVQALVNMVWFVVIQLLIYVLFYSVAIAAVCMTGNMVISVLGCGVLAVYSYLLYVLKLELYNTFFDTYYYYSNEQIWAFSPVHLIANLIMAYDESGSVTFAYSDYTMYFVKMLIQAAVYTLIALVLYKKRPTEAAGKSIAFRFIEPIVKTMVVLPVAILCAYIFSNMVMDDSQYVWYIFGGLFGFALSCLVMEVIFRQNVREAFAHKKQIAVNGIIVAALFISFRFDVFGYDYYIPVNVESYGIVISNLNYIGGYNVDSREWCMDKMKITPNENTIKLMEKAVDTSEIAYKEEESEGGIHHYNAMLVKYNLDNGKTVYRNYMLDLYDDEIQQLLADIYNSEEYKLGAYPIFTEGWKQDYNAIEVTTSYAQDNFMLKDGKLEKLLEVYQKELKALSYEELWSEFPVAEVSFMKRSSESSNNYTRSRYEYGYPIYDSFTETIALLREYNCIMLDTIDTEQIISIEVEDWSIENNDNNGELDKVMRVTYTQEDAQKVAEIMENVVSSALADRFNPDLCDWSIEVMVEFEHEGKEYSRSVYFKPNSIPEWLTEDLEASATWTEAQVYEVDGEIAVAVPVYE